MTKKVIANNGYQPEIDKKGYQPITNIKPNTGAGAGYQPISNGSSPTSTTPKPPGAE